MNRLCRAIARMAMGTPPPVRAARDVLRRWPAFMPDENPMLSDQGNETRRNAALKLLEDDCYGFLLLTVHRVEDDLRGEIRLAAALEPAWWPAVAETLDRIVESTR